MDTSSEDYILRALEYIERVKDHLGKAGDWNHQRKSDIEKGNFFRKRTNTLVPYLSVKHRVQFECHEQFILEGYLQLARNVLNQTENGLGIFALRVLIELGINKINILFAPEISEIERTEFKLIDCLSDLLGMEGEDYKNDFLKLLNEEKSMLSSNFCETFELAREKINKGEKVGLSILKKVRHSTNDRQAKLTQKISMLDILQNKTSFGLLNINLSHLLHGNPITIKVATEAKFASRRKKWITAILWSTSINILARTKNFVSDPELSKEISSVLNLAEAEWKKMLQ